MKSYDQYLKIVDGDGDQCGRGGLGGVDAAGAVVGQSVTALLTDEAVRRQAT